MSGAVHDVVEHLVKRILLRLGGGLAHVHVVPGIRSKFIIQSKGFYCRALRIPFYLKGENLGSAAS